MSNKKVTFRYENNAPFASHSLYIPLCIFLINTNLPQVPKPVIPEALLIGNPASNRLKNGPPIKAFEGGNLHSGARC